MEEERERVVLELIGHAALTTDDQGVIRYLNRGAAAAFNRSTEELVGTALQQVSTDNSDAGPVAVMLRRAGESGRPISCSARAGSRLSFRVVDIENGSRYLLLGEAETSPVNTRSSQNLIASLAHELSNPLTYTLASLEIALRKLEEVPAETLAEPLATVVNYVRNAHEGACRMRNIAKKMTLIAAPVGTWVGESELIWVLDHALSLAWNELRHAVSVIKHYAASPRVIGDYHSLTRALAELLAFAADEYRQAGTTELSLSVRQDDQSAYVEITCDHGDAGAPTQKTIDESRLAFAREAIEATGGQLKLTQPSPNGKRCYGLVLPLVGTRQPPTDATHLTAVPSKSARVLFIDDEPLLAETLRLAFGDDHDVQAVTSARAALALLERDRDFDLILCDLMMPGQSGAAVFEQLQRTAPELVRRFVLMTGGAFTPTSVSFLEAFPGLTLEKPFQVQDVEALIVQFRELNRRR